MLGHYGRSDGDSPSHEALNRKSILIKMHHGALDRQIISLRQSDKGLMLARLPHRPSKAYITREEEVDSKLQKLDQHIETL